MIIITFLIPLSPPSLCCPIFKAMIGLIIVGSIHSILSDELIMGRAQRRIGPFNLGGYGFPLVILSLYLRNAPSRIDNLHTDVVLNPR